MNTVFSCGDLYRLLLHFLSASPAVNRRAACPHTGDRESAGPVGGDVDHHTDASQPEHVSPVVYQERATVDTGFLHCL